MYTEVISENSVWLYTRRTVWLLFLQVEYQRRVVQPTTIHTMHVHNRLKHDFRCIAFTKRKFSELNSAIQIAYTCIPGYLISSVFLISAANLSRNRCEMQKNVDSSYISFKLLKYENVPCDDAMSCYFLTQSWQRKHIRAVSCRNLQNDIYVLIRESSSSDHFLFKWLQQADALNRLGECLAEAQSFYSFQYTLLNQKYIVIFIASVYSLFLSFLPFVHPSVNNSCRVLLCSRDSWE